MREKMQFGYEYIICHRYKHIAIVTNIYLVSQKVTNKDRKNFKTKIKRKIDEF
ncbi:hypothetical protein DESAMIL20_676 [Desulfurella amilsii]|uniref:Uncharacterized protein n=1 Tax=Desulfurella amilsii TaxID=1562698 RepID=A0A1X4XY70_9BACT|nr:hypothetical protein DESAMIL20_676 [Desulfurella amilsii]